MKREGRPAEPSGGSHGAALRWSARLLVAASWISGAIFAIYIIAFFGGVIVAGAGERWNELFPDLYDGEALLSTAAIGSHFMAGGVLLLLGPVQLIGSVRRSVPALHRWLGRIYVLSAGLAGLAGLGFIWGRGTIGGPLMDTGIGIYGALMVLCAAMAYARARADKYDQHRAWAIRLFALTVGSWLYRMEYGAWVPAIRWHWDGQRFYRLVRRDHDVLFLCPQYRRRRTLNPGAPPGFRRGCQLWSSNGASGCKRHHHLRDLELHCSQLGAGIDQRYHGDVAIGRPPTDTGVADEPRFA
ncbi:DUF2306 domain-containing protein [Phyllobacterium endophyticum]|uniref:DUF2306 domain-containing protein n=1 Tax=Phyllobacterium endophyticum TaxID=1149773 RepID=UPI0017FD98AE|nr:DUF2306 domain-containing protein [Phyllobacterium endophyticum]MBB3236906.1 hypothetical protein [Phyllobacterium endophyticum]